MTTTKDLFSPSRCEICGGIIIGAFCIDGLGRKACLTHKEIVQCLGCGGICSSEKSRKLSDGEWICPSCMENIPSAAEYSEIEKYIRNQYIEFGLGEIPHFTLKLVEIEELSKRIGKTVHGYAEERNGRYCIYILKHLSKTPYAGVLAHEMLHLWQMSRHLRMPNDISEGFCNLGSYEILKSIRSRIALNRMSAMERDTDKDYGEGFRKIKKIYDKEGWTGVIARMHN